MDIKQRIQERTATLQRVKKELKEEFFGIDPQIDKIFDSIQSWYIMPEIINYPVIVNLWSMTGNGKTALVRSLVKRLGLGNKFCELQFSDSGISNTTERNLTDCIYKAGILDREQGIVLLDEFQRYKTKDDHGQDIKGHKFQDVWMLLSDGKLPRKNVDNIVRRLEDRSTHEWAEVDGDYEYGFSEKRAKSKFHGAEYLFDITENLLDYSVKPEELRQINLGQALELVKNHLKLCGNVHDFTKCLIFVAGNLDEAFSSAGDVANCDMDADYFHEQTKKISIIDIKESLGTRFRPEQIARLGNNHVIYPSLNKNAFEKIIEKSCREYLERAQETSGISLKMGESIIKNIYENSVYPTQGTRPVFSTIHKMFGSPLSSGILWGLYEEKKELVVDIDPVKSTLTFSTAFDRHEVPIEFEIRDRKKRYSKDYSSLVSVHEMGHAILYTTLFETAPLEIKINVASFTGGYNLYASKHACRKDILDQICVSFGGIVAEEIVFGADLRSTGCRGDIEKATKQAALFIRRYAMNGMESFQSRQSEDFNTDYDLSNQHIEIILKEQKKRAYDLVQQKKEFLIKSSRDLLEKKEFSKEEFEEYAKGEFTFKEDVGGEVRGNYFELLHK